MEIDGGGVWGSSFLHASDDFLSFVTVVDIGCKHPLVCVVAAGDVQGVETEGCGLIRKIGEARVFVIVCFRFAMIVDGLFYHLDPGGGAS